MPSFEMVSARCQEHNVIIPANTNIIHDAEAHRKHICSVISGDVAVDHVTRSVRHHLQIQTRFDICLLLESAGEPRTSLLMRVFGRPFVDHASCPTFVLFDDRNRFLDGIAYQEAVQYAMDNTDSTDTLIISTADHGHSISYNGYCGRGSSVTGLCMGVDKAATEHTGTPNYAADGLPYTVISVGNGPGSVLYVRIPPAGTRGEKVRPSRISPLSVAGLASENNTSAVAVSLSVSNMRCSSNCGMLRSV